MLLIVTLQDHAKLYKNMPSRLHDVMDLNVKLLHNVTILAMCYQQKNDYNT